VIVGIGVAVKSPTCSTPKLSGAIVLELARLYATPVMLIVCAATLPKLFAGWAACRSAHRRWSGISDRERTGAGAECDRAEILLGHSAAAEHPIRDSAAVDAGLDCADHEGPLVPVLAIE